MCELFGVSSREKVSCNELLREFFSHAAEHPDGWGLAVFYGCEVSIEKEPVSALESVYLKHRLTDDITEDVLLAHIRKASVGGLCYKNSHPFAQRDAQGRLWTLIHNGTIFDNPELEPYRLTQRGGTDSERILCRLIDALNAGHAAKGSELSARERFSVVEGVVRAVTPGNKVNLIIYDGEQLYFHSNHRGSLYMSQDGDTLIVTTRAFCTGSWAEVPLNTVFAACSGRVICSGEPHGNEYVKAKSPDDP